MGNPASGLEDVLTRIDAANRADPNTETVGGVEYPKELLYAQRMSAWLQRLRPDAPDVLRIAARAQHLERWTVSRADFPQGRSGYLRWRTVAAAHHARRTAELMQEVGYAPSEVAAVCALLRKEGLATAAADSDVQALEDIACLVFLESYLGAFAPKHDAEKVTTILTRTWRKMSPAARREALQAGLDADTLRLLEDAGAASE